MFQLTSLKDVYLGNGDDLQDLDGPEIKTLQNFLGETPINSIEITFTKKSSVTEAEVHAFSAIFCDSKIGEMHPTLTLTCRINTGKSQETESCN